VKRAAIAIALVVGARAQVASAGHCGGGGGGGGHASGGGGGGPVASCSDSSDIVGYRQCTKFGAWSNTLLLPEIFVELGVEAQRFTSQLGDSDGSLAHGGEQFSYRIIAPPRDAGADTAVITKLRIGVGLGRTLYMGGELGVGGLVAVAPADAEMTSAGVFGRPDLAQRRGVAADLLGFVGARGSVGNAVLSVELAGGGRSVAYRFESTYHDCDQSTFVTTFAGVAEARARAEHWLGPRFAAGAVLGTSLVDRASWSAGVFLGFHTRAFGGL
jgi:hypothetical protein